MGLEWVSREQGALVFFATTRRATLFMNDF
jgi:hypothetical protein